MNIKRLLPDIKQPRLHPTSLESLLKEIAESYGVQVWQVTSSSRKQRFYRVRSVFAWRARQEGFTQEQIGEILNRDHSTVSNMLTNFHNRDNGKKT